VSKCLLQLFYETLQGLLEDLLTFDGNPNRIEALPLREALDEEVLGVGMMSSRSLSFRSAETLRCNQFLRHSRNRRRGPSSLSYDGAASFVVPILLPCTLSSSQIH
jgi:hypothetical protein